MNRFVGLVTAGLLLSALFAWWIKGDLEMGWLVAWPVIIGVTVILVGLGSFALPRGFPRVAACLAAFPFGLLLAWVAASTTNHWPEPPSVARMEDARAIAADFGRLQDIARGLLRLPVEVGSAIADSADGVASKVSGRLTLEHRPPQVRIAVSFAVGPYAPLRLDVATDGALTPIEPLPAVGELVIRPDAVVRRYPDVPMIEVGGPGPFVPGRLVPVRLVRGEQDWEIAILQVAVGEDALAEVARVTRVELAAGMGRALRARGLAGTGIRTYFRPAGDRLMFFQRPSFEFQTRLAGGGFVNLRATLAGDSIVYEVAEIRR